MFRTAVVLGLVRDVPAPGAGDVHKVSVVGVQRVVPAEPDLHLPLAAGSSPTTTTPFDGNSTSL